MPNGEDTVDDEGNTVAYQGEDQCPRRHIKEDPFWWDQLISTYNAKEDGILPHAGGLSSQPALYSTVMSIISSALEDERDLEREKKEKRDSSIAASQQAQAEGQTLGNGKGYQYLNPPTR